MVRYWKNRPANYSGQFNYVSTYSITVDSNNDVYVAGYDKGPCYWKNGVKTNFASDNYSLKYAIASGGNVYAVAMGSGPGYFVNGEFVAFGDQALLPQSA